MGNYEELVHRISCRSLPSPHQSNKITREQQTTSNKVSIGCCRVRQVMLTTTQNEAFRFLEILTCLA
jgi:hypothetical protein